MPTAKDSLDLLLATSPPRSPEVIGPAFASALRRASLDTALVLLFVAGMLVVPIAVIIAVHGDWSTPSDAVGTLVTMLAVATLYGGPVLLVSRAQRRRTRAILVGGTRVIGTVTAAHGWWRIATWRIPALSVVDYELGGKRWRCRVGARAAIQVGAAVPLLVLPERPKRVLVAVDGPFARLVPAVARRRR